MGGEGGAVVSGGTIRKFLSLKGAIFLLFTGKCTGLMGHSRENCKIFQR